MTWHGDDNALSRTTSSIWCGAHDIVDRLGLTFSCCAAPEKGGQVKTMLAPTPPVVSEGLDFSQPPKFGAIQTQFQPDVPKTEEDAASLSTHGPQAGQRAPDVKVTSKEGQSEAYQKKRQLAKRQKSLTETRMKTALKRITETKSQLSKIKKAMVEKESALIASADGASTIQLVSHLAQLKEEMQNAQQTISRLRGVYSMCQGQNDRAVEEYKQIRNEGIAMFISNGDSFTSRQTNSFRTKNFSCHGIGRQGSFSSDCRGSSQSPTQDASLSPLRKQKG